MHAFGYIVLRVNFDLTSCEDLATALGLTKILGRMYPYLLGIGHVEQLLSGFI